MLEKQDGKSVGIWIRVSHEHSVESESPEHHEYRARQYADLKGWHVAKLYRLDAVSGKSIIDLPTTQQMLEDMRRGRITGLIFSKLARFARNNRELLYFCDEFQKYDADLISLQESIDTSTPSGRLFYALHAALAQWEREEIAERIAASVPVRAKLGKRISGVAPFGYQWKDKEFLPNPSEAPVVKLMYELFLEHRRKNTVARKLNEAGHRTRRGAKFSYTTVRRILKDPANKGKRRANYTKSIGDGKHWVYKPESEWVWQEVEPIVSADLWNQVNDILADQKKKYKRPGRRPVQLFSGLTFCECGQKMYVLSNSPKYTCQKCRNKISVEDINKVFYDQLKEFIFSPTDIANYLHQADDALQEKADLVALLEKEKSFIERAMDKLYSLYQDDNISSREFGRRYGKHEERLKQLEKEVPRLQGEHDFLNIKQLGSTELFESAKTFYSQWPQLELKEKRTVVENIVHRIEVKEDTVVFDLAFAPQPAHHPSSWEVVAKSHRTGMNS